MNLNRLLKRQIKKSFGNVEHVPKEFLPFINSVNQSYIHYENDRNLLENIMTVNSKELTESNALLRSVAHAQNSLLENLKSALTQLRANNSIHNSINGREEIKLENISEIIQQEIRIKNQHEESLKKSEKIQEYQLIVQGIISKLLKLTHKNGELKELMSEALDIILELHVTQTQPKIGIFLANRNKIRLISQKNFPSDLLDKYSKDKIQYKTFLSRESLEKEEIFFTSSDHFIDGENLKNETHYGQYNVPILCGDIPLGLLVIYLPHKYKRNEIEIKALKSIAATLSLILNKNKADKELVKIKMAIEQSESSIVITNSKNEIEYVNPFFEKLSGYSFKDVEGKNPKLIKSNVTTVSTYKEMWKTLKKEGKWKGELCNKKKNGELFWENVNISTIKNKNGHAINYVAVKDDITEQKALAKILKKKEKEYQEIVESANDAIYRTDHNDKFNYANTLLEQITGYSNKELMKMYLID